MKCLNNTHGRACNLCAPGYYGDAVKLKDCRSCDCEMLGTKYCDSFVGKCNCHVNVIGERCDRCEDNHYGYDSGLGGKPCDCAIASNSSQCDYHSGECACKPGVAGRQCDRCAADHWDYSVDGCVREYYNYLGKFNFNFSVISSQLVPAIKVILVVSVAMLLMDSVNASRELLVTNAIRVHIAGCSLKIKAVQIAIPAFMRF